MTESIDHVAKLREYERFRYGLDRARRTMPEGANKFVYYRGNELCSEEEYEAAMAESTSDPFKAVDNAIYRRMCADLSGDDPVYVCVGGNRGLAFYDPDTLSRNDTDHRGGTQEQSPASDKAANPKQQLEG